MFSYFSATKRFNLTFDCCDVFIRLVLLYLHPSVLFAPPVASLFADTNLTGCLLLKIIFFDPNLISGPVFGEQVSLFY